MTTGKTIALTRWTWVWASSGSWWCYSPWGCKESDMTEQLNNGKESSTHIYTYIYIHACMCESVWFIYKDKTTLEINYVLSCFSHVWLFAPLWTVDCQAPLSTGFSRQEYCSGLPFPPLVGVVLIRDRTRVSSVSCIGRWVLFSLAWPGKPWKLLHLNNFLGWLFEKIKKLDNH